MTWPVCFSERTECADVTEASSVFHIWIDHFASSQLLMHLLATKCCCFIACQYVYRKLYRLTDALP